MRKEARQKLVKTRKNFFPTLVITAFLWALIVGLVYFVEPDLTGAIFAFFILVFLALLFTFSIIFTNSRRGLLAALGLTLFIILRYFGVGNILNFLLILGVEISIEFYFSRRY